MLGEEVEDDGDVMRGTAECVDGVGDVRVGEE